MYTLQDLVRFTGAKRRSVQLWAEAGAIVAAPATERAGAGVHRSFSEDEVVVACVVAAFAQDNAPIGFLLRVGKDIRALMSTPRGKENVYKAVINVEKLFLIYDKGDNPTIFGPRHPDFCEVLRTYFLYAMKDSNIKANIVYLNGCFARLRNEAPFAKL